MCTDLSLSKGRVRGSGCEMELQSAWMTLIAACEWRCCGTMLNSSVPVCHYRDDIIPLQHLGRARTHAFPTCLNTHNALRAIVYCCSRLRSNTPCTVVHPEVICTCACARLLGKHSSHKMHRSRLREAISANPHPPKWWLTPCYWVSALLNG